MISSYSKIYALGHKETIGIFDGPYTVEEKVDGSQFSFGKYKGELKCRSRGKELILDAPEKLFVRAVEVVQSIADKLVDGWTYRGEYLAKPKHNVLAYDRTPINNIVIFDIDIGNQFYCDPVAKRQEAERIGLECVPFLGSRETPLTAQEMQKILESTSFLGGQKIEGFVVKNYRRYDRSGKILMAKYVSEAFKEIHRKMWREFNPSGKDMLTQIGDQYRSQARWNKAVQHLAEAGRLDGSPKDIGPLMKEVHNDIDDECRGEIAEQLLKWAMPHIKRRAAYGLPQWYKEKLAKNVISEV